MSGGGFFDLSSSSKREKLKDKPEFLISNATHSFKLGSEIGRGSFGIVFQALNVNTGDFVAVKRFPLEAIRDDSLSSIEVRL